MPNNCPDCPDINKLDNFSETGNQLAITDSEIEKGLTCGRLNSGTLNWLFSKIFKCQKLIVDNYPQLDISQKGTVKLEVCGITLNATIFNSAAGDLQFTLNDKTVFVVNKNSVAGKLVLNVNGKTVEAGNNLSSVGLHQITIHGKTTATSNSNSTSGDLKLNVNGKDTNVTNKNSVAGKVVIDINGNTVEAGNDQSTNGEHKIVINGTTTKTSNKASSSGNLNLNVNGKQTNIKLEDSGNEVKLTVVGLLKKLLTNNTTFWMGGNNSSGSTPPTAKPAGAIEVGNPFFNKNGEMWNPEEGEWWGVKLTDPNGGGGAAGEIVYSASGACGIGVVSGLVDGLYSGNYTFRTYNHSMLGSTSTVQGSENRVFYSGHGSTGVLKGWLISTRNSDSGLSGSRTKCTGVTSVMRIE